MATMLKYFVILNTMLTISIILGCEEEYTPIGNGVNLQPSYYNSGAVTFGWSLMKNYPKIRTVRIEIEPSVDINVVVGWIKEAQSKGYNVIATYHKHHVLGMDDPNELMSAAEWWVENYRTLAGNGPIVINLMDEWGSHYVTANQYALAYNQAIDTVRQVYNGPIIIDLPGWGQGTAVAASAVKGEGYSETTIQDTNIVLSVHVYPLAWNMGKGRHVEKWDLDDLASTNRPCMIGEFGDSPSGPVDWMGIVKYARQKNWTVLGWSWNGDGDRMNMVNPEWKWNPTADQYYPSSYFDTIYQLL